MRSQKDVARDIVFFFFLFFLFRFLFSKRENRDTLVMMVIYRYTLKQNKHRTSHADDL